MHRLVFNLLTLLSRSFQWLNWKIHFPSLRICYLIKMLNDQVSWAMNANNVFSVVNFEKVIIFLIPKIFTLETRYQLICTIFVRAIYLHVSNLFFHNWTNQWHGQVISVNFEHNWLPSKHRKKPHVS